MRTYKREINEKINEIYDLQPSESAYSLEQLNRWKKLSEELTQLLKLEIVVQSFEYLPKYNCGACDLGPCQVRSRVTPTLCPNNNQLGPKFKQDTSAPF